MAVVDVASRFNMSRHRVYQLSRRRGPRRPPILQRLYISQYRFEITMASIAAFEASIVSINDEHRRDWKPGQPINLRRGVPA